MAKVEEDIKAYKEAKSTSNKLSGDVAKYTNNFRGGGRGRGSGPFRGRGRGGNNAPGENTGKYVSLCNACNKPNHMARDCFTKDKLTCIDCPKTHLNAGKGHKNKFSGRCPLNPSKFTVPQPNESGQPPPQQAPPAFPPQQAPPAFPPCPPSADAARAANAIFPYGMGHNMPAAPYITDATQWAEMERQK